VPELPDIEELTELNRILMESVRRFKLRR